MSTSELRRGPGWWMDLEGQWKPPEEWPEATPPLPGWTRGNDGKWFQPPFAENLLDETADAPQHERTTSDESTTGVASATRPVPDLGASSVPPLDSLIGEQPGPNEPFDPKIHPQRRVTPDRRAAPTKKESVFTFAEGTANLPVFDDGSRHRRQALTAAMLAAVTASMLAAGLVLLLLLV